MKQNFLRFLPFILFAITLSVSSCDNDPCKDVTCGPNSACFDGDCICDFRYEKDANGDCVLERVKFLGSWTVEDICSSSGTTTYTVTVIAGTEDNQVKISNVWNLFTNSVNATVSGASIDIPRQDPDSDGFFVEGTGTINNNLITISWTYDITDETDPGNIETDSCTATWTKN